MNENYKNLKCYKEIENPKEKLTFGEMGQIIVYDKKLCNVLTVEKCEHCSKCENTKTEDH